MAKSYEEILQEKRCLEEANANKRKRDAMTKIEKSILQKLEGRPHSQDNNYLTFTVPIEPSHIQEFGGHEAVSTEIAKTWGLKMWEVELTPTPSSELITLWLKRDLRNYPL